MRRMVYLSLQSGESLSPAVRACLQGGGGPQVGEVTCGGSPHLSCKQDQIKMRDYMDRWVQCSPYRAVNGKIYRVKQHFVRLQLLEGLIKLNK